MKEKTNGANELFEIESNNSEVIDSTSTIADLTGIVESIERMISKHFMSLFKMDGIDDLSQEELQIERDELKQNINNALILFFEKFDERYIDWKYVLEELRNQSKIEHNCNSEEVDINIRIINGYIGAIQARCTQIGDGINRLIIFINDISDVINLNCKTAKKEPPMAIRLAKKLMFNFKKG